MFFVDVDECSAGTHQCDTNANCVNSFGSYHCSCNAGFISKGNNCLGTYNIFV